METQSRMDLAFCKDRLSAAGVKFDVGLTAEEFSAIERDYQLRFPSDLREFLGYALPISKGWIDWRRESRENIISRLDLPLEGMCYDIEHNAFWLASWGARPQALADACAVARRAVEAAPRLIPICSHRYLPDRPSEAGNPVFSVHQTDIIYYGTDLFDYLSNEFSYHFGRAGYVFNGGARHIEFWSELIQ
jgi:hypothetical protein